MVLRAPIEESERMVGRLARLPFLEFGRRLSDRIASEELLDRAAGLSFYFLLALFPAVLFTTALFGLMAAPERLDELLGYAQRMLPSDAASLFGKAIEEIAEGAGTTFVSLGIAGSLWAASNGMGSIIRALNKIFSVGEPRSWWRRSLSALCLTACSSLFAFLSASLLAAGSKTARWFAARAGLGPWFPSVFAATRWVLVTAAAMALIGLIYRLAPAGRGGRPWLTPGAAFAVSIWLAASWGLRACMDAAASYNAVYGSIGGVLALLLWLYLTAFALLAGAALDAEIERPSASSVN